MTVSMHNRRKARGANHLAVERFYPGVACKWCAFDEDHIGRFTLHITVEATADVLIQLGLTTREQLGRIPRCGVKGKLRRTKRGTFQVKKYWHDDIYDCEKREAQEMAAKIGIARSQRLESSQDKGSRSRVPATDASPSSDKVVARPAVEWTARGNIIFLQFPQRDSTRPSGLMKELRNELRGLFDGNFESTLYEAVLEVVRTTKARRRTEETSNDPTRSA